MSRAGYRNTAPARVFFSFNKDALEEVGAGLFNYDDPLDLANTFLSFYYSPSQPTNANSGMFKLELINPNTNIEKILFAKYGAFQPRSWKAQEDASGVSELTQFILDNDWGYFRWGYVSDTTDGEQTTALSHIHEAQLIEIDYNLNSNQDRIVTLRFVDSFGAASRGLYESELSVPNSRIVINRPELKKRLTDNWPSEHAYQLRNVDDVLGERLLTILGYADDYQLLNLMSDSHREVLREGLNLLYTEKMRAWATTDYLKFENSSEKGARRLSHAARNYDISKQRIPTALDRPDFLTGPPVHDADLYWWDKEARNITGFDGGMALSKAGVALGTWAQFAIMLGGTLRAPSNPHSTKPTPNAQPSLGQDGLSNQGTPDDPNLKNEGQAQNNALTVTDETVRVEVTVEPNLLLTGVGTGQNTNPLSVVPPWYVCEYTLTDGLKVDFTLDELRELYGDLNPATFGMPTNRFKCISKDIYDDYGNQWDASLQQGLLATNATGGNGFMMDGPLTLTTDGAVYTALTELESKYTATNQESFSNGAHASSTLEASEAITQEVPDEVEPPPPAPLEGYTIIFEDRGKYPLELFQDTINLINNLYIRYQSNKRLDVFKVEYANIPQDKRDAFEQRVGLDIDWNKAGAFLLGDATMAKEIYDSFYEGIKSFAIEIEDDDDRISLASGFSKRKDNIITDISFTQIGAKMATAMRMAPSFNSNFYRVAERFEDPDYRDKLFRVVSYDWTRATTKLQTENRRQREVLRQERLEFVDDLTKNNLAAALNYSEIAGESDVNPSIPTLTKDMKEDLAYILNSGFMDVFFPIDTGSESRITIQTNSDEDPVTRDIPYYRTMSLAPMTSLLKIHEDNDAAEKSIALAAKMGVLSQLQNTIAQANVTTLGIPEMDLLDMEIGKRTVALWVTEPRNPGTYNWITGNYTLVKFTHRIDRNGYRTDFELYPVRPQVAEELVKHQMAFIQDD